MDFEFTNEENMFRQEVRNFLSSELGVDWLGVDPDSYFEEENWPFLRRLTSKLADRGWLTLAWPEKYGGQGRPYMDQLIYNEETAYFRAPTRDMTIGTDLVGPTLMLYGTNEQKAQLLPGIVNGSAVYCQGFSEPGSGSDLASLQLRAIQDGDDYLLTGTKVWTSGAHRATHCYIMARTDFDAPKHRGISVFIVDMNTPGIEISPIPNMFDVHYFNQIFFDSVRVPKTNMIGEKNRGWYVAATSLDFERSGVSRFASNRRNLEELVSLAKESGIHSDPLLRNRLASLWASNVAGTMVAYKVGWMQSHGAIPNKEASLSKLIGSEIAQQIHQLGIRMTGMFGILHKDSAWVKLNGRLAMEWMDSISFTIRSGTSEIQRNIIATRGLGLPRS